MPKRKKRKLSAYNRHMKAEMKKGKTFKQAVKSWKGGKSKTKKRSVSRMAKKKVVRRRKSSGFDKGLMGLGLGALLYGAGREYVSERLIRPVTDRVPVLNTVGQYGDEVGMLIFSYALAKGKIPYLNKFPVTRQVGKAGIVIEASRIGANFIPNFMPSSQAPAQSTRGSLF